MKIALHFIALMLCTLVTVAQSTVNIQVNHLLDGEQYENGVNSINDLENDFMIDRLEYYISRFSITHDGGQVIEIDDLYVLVSLLNRTDPTLIELGTYDIEVLESISFYFGIDEEANHADPTLHDPEHALAPKFPSMHWGWAAGYRFIALEGLSGPNVDQELQFHCIGDEFYTKLDFPVTMSDQDEYVVQVDAEYTNLLKGIDVSGGLILHGALGEIQTLATNLSENVFTSSSLTNTEDNPLVNSFDAFPNPVSNGVVTLEIDITSSNNLVQVVDAMGRVIFQASQKPTMQIELQNPGLFYISITDTNGNALASRKVLVQK